MSDEGDDRRRFQIETWTLYGIGIIWTLLRMFSRIRSVGFRYLTIDDYLAFLAMVRKSTLRFPRSTIYMHKGQDQAGKRNVS